MAIASRVVHGKLVWNSWDLVFPLIFALIVGGFLLFIGTPSFAELNSNKKLANAYIKKGVNSKDAGDIPAATKALNEAIEFATKACELSGWHRWDCIATLAAAYAEASDWENAVKRQEQVLGMMGVEIDRVIGGEIERERLELYKQHKPYREQAQSITEAAPGD